MLERALDCLIKLLNNYQLNGFLDEMKIFLICFSNPSVKFSFSFFSAPWEIIYFASTESEKEVKSCLVRLMDVMGKCFFFAHNFFQLFLLFVRCHRDFFNHKKLELNVAATQLFIKIWIKYSEQIRSTVLTFCYIAHLLF
jgi:hypothetical protein